MGHLDRTTATPPLGSMRCGHVVQHGEDLGHRAGLIGDGPERDAHDPRFVTCGVEAQVVSFELHHALEHPDECGEDLGLLVLGAQPDEVRPAQLVGGAAPGTGERG